MRAKAQLPVTRVEELSWVVADVEGALRSFGDESTAAFANAGEAVEGLKYAERLRRLADAIALRTLEDVTESRVVDEHGYASAKVMYGAVNKQSGSDLYALEQIRVMLRRCDQLQDAVIDGRLSREHLRLLGRAYANKRVRERFIDEQAWFLHKAKRFDFRRFEILVNRWENTRDEDGSKPDDSHERRSASSVQDHFSQAWQFRSTQAPLVGAAMSQIEQSYTEAEFAKDWEAAKAKHGDKVCKDLLPRTDAQRRADAVAQIYADAAANPKSSMPFKFVHHIVWSADVYFEMVKRYAGAAPAEFNVDTFRCETSDGHQLEVNEAFFDSLVSPLRRVLIDAKGVVTDMSDQRFFTGLARTALQISHDECEWIGCHVPASRCQADHIVAKSRGGPTDQVNGAILCQRHNRHKERGYTVWRDEMTRQLRIKTPAGAEITDPWE